MLDDSSPFLRALRSAGACGRASPKTAATAGRPSCVCCRACTQRQAASSIPEGVTRAAGSAKAAKMVAGGRRMKMRMLKMPCP